MSPAVCRADGRRRRTRSLRRPVRRTGDPRDRQSQFHPGDEVVLCIRPHALRVHGATSIHAARESADPGTHHKPPPLPAQRPTAGGAARGGVPARARV